jgi:hypothetical protein
MIRFPLAPAALLIAASLVFAADPAQAIPMDTVILQGLDKITARVSTIDVPVGGTVEFGALRITARACDKHPPEETPEAAAFLEVVEVKPDEKPVLRFSGWMFASSPALSALEHPVYDLKVLDCVNKSDGAGTQGAGTQGAGTEGTGNQGTGEQGSGDGKAATGGQAPADAAPSKSSNSSGGSSQ